MATNLTARINYVDADQRVNIAINLFLKDQVKDLINKVDRLLKSKKMPSIVENKNKCAVCGLREKCHSLVTDEKQNI